MYFDSSVGPPFTNKHVNPTFTDNIMDNYRSGAVFIGVNGGEIARNDIQALDATLIEIGGASSNVSINHNILHNGARGVRIEELRQPQNINLGIGLNTNITVIRNSITNMALLPEEKGNPNVFGVGSLGGQAADVDATCNWWVPRPAPARSGPALAAR